jgi:HD-GYP domain-containing protein (c-di-GMP phosphodiesterase class II)
MEEKPVTINFVPDAPPDQNTIRKHFDDRKPNLDSVLDEASSDVGGLTRLRDQLEVLYSMGNLIHSERNLDTIFSIAADSILKVSRGARSAIIMIDPATGAPTEVVALSGDDKFGKTEFPVSRTIVEETFQQGVCLLSSDAMCDERFKSSKSVNLQKIRSVMSVPVRNEDRTTGVIYVDTSSLFETFTEGDLQLLAALGKQLGVAIERASLIAGLEDLFVGIIHTLVATIEAKDRYTKGHSERVTNFSMAIASKMNLERKKLAVLELSGLLHDVGKIGVPESVLNKNGKLTDEEFAIIKQHPNQGAHIIRNIKNIERIIDMNEIIEAVLHHHEEYNGRGYPGGLAQEGIPLIARILTIADTYDAITSDRPYRKGRDSQIAVDEIQRCAGDQFDPDCVEAFMTALESGEIEQAKSAPSRFP